MPQYVEKAAWCRAQIMAAAGSEAIAVQCAEKIAEKIATMRKAANDEAARREAEAKRTVESEAKHKAEMEEAARREATARRKAEMEEAVRREAAAQGKAEMEEAARREAAARRKVEAEATRLEEEVLAEEARRSEEIMAATQRAEEAMARQVEETICSESSSSADVTAVAACRARCRSGQQCRHRVHKNAGKGSHRAHTCAVHRSFTGELCPAEQSSAEKHDLAPPSMPPPPSPPLPPPPSTMQTELEAERERARKRSLDAHRKSLELREMRAALEEERQRSAVAEVKRQAEEAAGKVIAPPPSSWIPLADGSATQMIPLSPSSSEWHQVEAACLRTMRGGRYTVDASKAYAIRSVERVQSPALWRQYALRRSEIQLRERASDDEMRRYERLSLFHGTDSATAAKIAHSGFNRSFAGKNATRLGRGVYFAKMLGYSLDPKYAIPDAAGLQRVFLCRILVGEYCQGTKDILVPPVRRSDPHLLFDSTVDDERRPEIFVTFHDSQAYPEYLVTLYRRNTAT